MENNKTKKVVKKKRKKIKWGYVLACLAILLVLILLIKLVLPGNSSKYGNRLDGIKKISFKKNAQEKITSGISKNDKVTEAKIDIKGKIITIIFNVKKDVSVDDARKIANDSLSNISDEVKGFYDIQYMISKNDEEPVKEEKDGKTIEKTIFPIMGYKNSKSDKIVW